MFFLVFAMKGKEILLFFIALVGVARAQFCRSSSELDPFTGSFLCQSYCNNKSFCDSCENCITKYDAKEGAVCPQRCADWAALGWGKCSTSCGPGNRTRVVRCVSDTMSWKPSAERLPCYRDLEPPSLEGCNATVRNACSFSNFRLVRSVSFEKRRPRPVLIIFFPRNSLSLSGPVLMF